MKLKVFLKIFFILLLLSFLPALTPAQSLYHVTGTLNNQLGVPIPGAAVWVCQSDSVPNFANTPPCTTVAVYSNINGAFPITQPGSTAPVGNYDFYVAPGTYVVALYKLNITATSYTLTAPCTVTASACGVGAGVSSINAQTGAVTIQGGGSTTVTTSGGVITVTSTSGLADPGSNGIVFRNGLNATRTSTSTDVYSLFGCAGVNTTYLNGAGGCSTPASSGLSGVSVVNGVLINQNDFQTCGENPYADIRCYGTYATYSSTTATTTASSAIVNLSSAQNFQNGEYVTIFNAGAANGISAMGTVTLTPSINAGGLNTIAGNTGSTPFSYEVIAANKFGGYTAASAAASTTTGNTLGMASINITSFSRSGRVVTVTTSSTHPVPIGCSVGTCPVVYIKYPDSGASNPDNTFSGFFLVTSAADGTHFTYSSGLDTGAGASSATTGGTAIFFQSNHLSWSVVSGAIKYYIYGRTSAGYNLLGVTGLNFWDDYGSPMNDNQTFPPFIPTTAPSSGANNHLTAKILSGATTTALTLSTPATVGVTAGAVSDDGPALAAACNFQNCLIPETSSTMRVNSYTIINNGNIIIDGSLLLNDTLETTANITGSSNTFGPSFSWSSQPAISSSYAYPMICVTGSGQRFNNIYLQQSANNGGLAIADFCAGNGAVTNISMDYVSIATGGSSTEDYLSQGFIFQNAGFSFRFKKDTFLSGAPGSNSISNVGYSPMTWGIFKNHQQIAADTTGNFEIENMWFVGRADFDQDYVFNAGGENIIIAHDIQTQNSFLPAFMFTGYGEAGGWNISDLIPADFGTALVAELAPDPITSGFSMTNVPCLAGGNAAVTGGLFGGAHFYGVCNPGQNTSFFDNGYAPGLPVTTINGGTMGYQIAPPTAAPTVSYTSGGSFFTGSVTWKAAWLDALGNSTPLGVPSAAVNVVTGTQTANVSYGGSIPAGAVQLQYYFSVNNGGYILGGTASNACGPYATTATLVMTIGFSPCGTPAYQPAMLAGFGSAGTETDNLDFTGGGFKDTISGTFTANRTSTDPDVSGTFVKQAAGGTNCAPSYQFTGVGASATMSAVFIASCYSGATPDIQINACITAATAVGGVCDTRDFTGTQNFATNATLTCGAVGSTTPIEILLPESFTWNFTLTGGTAYMGTSYPGCSIIYQGAPNSGQMVNTSSSGGALGGWLVAPGTGGSGFQHLDGFTITQHGGGFAGGYALVVAGAVDNSIVNIRVFDSSTTDTAGAEWKPSGSLCCSAHADDYNYDGNSVGPTGLDIEGQPGGSTFTPWSITFRDASVGQVKAGVPNILCHDHNSTNQVSVNFDHLYMEPNHSTDTATAFVSIDGCASVHFKDVKAMGFVASSTKPIFTVSNFFNTDLIVDGLVVANFNTGSFTFPLQAVTNSFTGVQAFTDSNGFLSHYTPGVGWFGNLAMNGVFFGPRAHRTDTLTNTVTGQLVYTNPSASNTTQYSLHGYTWVTATGGAGTYSCTYTFNNGAGSQTHTLFSSISLTSLTDTAQSTSLVLGPSQALSYTCTFSGPSGSPSVNLDLTLEQVQ